MSELDQYDYDLPRDLIAQEPPVHRPDARLLVVTRQDQSLSHSHFRDLPQHLHSGDLLVLNDTRVIPARLVGKRTSTGGRWEGLFLRSGEHGVWQILSKTRGKLQPGETVTVFDGDRCSDLELEVLARLSGGQWALRPLSDEPPLELLDRVGRVPLPHYIRGGEMLPADRQRYQTVFARDPGSVAAPTAGLHFTKSMLDLLAGQGIDHVFVTLHVGLDTFRPITAESLADHEIHTEHGVLNDSTANRINRCRAQGGRVVAVGTTSVRVLETATAEDGTIRAWSGPTDLFIRPPYQFKATDALVTNFHLPRTTLLVLVRCFGGDKLMKRAYAEAVAAEYRFFSYGDAMLIV